MPFSFRVQLLKPRAADKLQMTSMPFLKAFVLTSGASRHCEYISLPFRCLSPPTWLNREAFGKENPLHNSTWESIFFRSFSSPKRLLFAPDVLDSITVFGDKGVHSDRLRWRYVSALVWNAIIGRKAGDLGWRLSCRNIKRHSRNDWSSTFCSL